MTYWQLALMTGILASIAYSAVLVERHLRDLVGRLEDILRLLQDWDKKS